MMVIGRLKDWMCAAEVEVRVIQEKGDTDDRGIG